MDDGEVRAIRAAMRALQRRLRQVAVPATGMSRSVLQVLATVDRLPDGAQPGQVATELHMTSSNVAAALRELEGAGLVRRVRSAEDARRILLTVTTAGAAVVTRFHDETDGWLGRAIDATLTASEQRELVRAAELLQRLADAADPTVPR